MATNNQKQLKELCLLEKRNQKVNLTELPMNENEGKIKNQFEFVKSSF